jgi:biotin carboxyl carrier protein
MKFVATVEGRAEVVEVTGADGRYRIRIGEQVWEVDARRTPGGLYSLLIDGASYVAHVDEREAGAHVQVLGETYAVQVEEHERHLIRTRAGAAAGGVGGQTLAAPMPGRVSHVAVRPGDRVEAGDALVVIEAMKMENELRAGTAGTVAEVRVAPGQTVNPGDILVVIAS